MTRIRIIIPAATIERTKLYLIRGAALLLCVLIFPLAAHASPFDSGISSIQTLFTGTVAKAASLIAIVIGGYTFAHGEPGAKKQRRSLPFRVHGLASEDSRLHSPRYGR
jgi:type IV secretion system protein VirB2